MASDRVTGRRLAWLACAPLLVLVANAALLGVAFQAAPVPVTSAAEWIQRMDQAAAGSPLSFGLLLGVPSALVFFCLLPVITYPAAPREGEGDGSPLQARTDATGAAAPSPRPPTPPAPVVADPAEALRLLAILQREGRFIDFLQEEIAGYEDAQIGAAVREIHSACRKALSERIELKPVLAGEEGATVTIEAGFDPASIRVTGNLSGNPPFRAVLRHGGWQAAKVSWPAPSKRRDPSIIAPAEVEIP